MMRTIRAVALAILLVAFPALGRAQLITSASAIPSGSTQVDLSAYYTGYWTFTSGPLLFNGGHITWQSTNPGSVIGNASYGLASNGTWNSAISSAAIGLNTGTGSYTFTFDSPISFFSGFMNYAPGYGPDVFLTAYGFGGSVLNAYDINTLAPISTPGGTNAGEVRGISHSSADIYAVSLSNEYVLANDFRFFSEAAIGPVPEPASMALMATGLFGLAGVIRRRRKLFE